MVYVISKEGEPLMPTNRHGKVRRMLNEKKAKVIRRCPFTIQLLYGTTSYTQELTLGIDAGSKMIGLSVTSSDKEYFSGEVELRNDIVELLATRRESRRTRRNRKTRYRKARFDNRRRSDKWLAPSIRQKIQCHMKMCGNVHEILPIRHIIVETASFDMQKIRNPEITGSEYQEGAQLGFWNVREYVLFRDGHTCRCCKGKSKDKVLNVHHIESRKTGGDSPENLITLCETCHRAYHKGLLKLPSSVKRGNSLRDAAFMGIMRWAFYEELKKAYPDVKMTYGYLTKNTRIRHGLEKAHRIDARCISGNPEAEPADDYYYSKKVRCHNRQIHKLNPKKGKRKLNQAPYIVCGYRLFDKVSYEGRECFIYGRRQRGYFKLNTLDGKCLGTDVNCKKLKFIETRKSYLTERRVAG